MTNVTDNFRIILQNSLAWVLDHEIPNVYVSTVENTQELPTGLLHHSDQDVLYCSGPYQRLLTDNRITCSMSGKGNCYDNACLESFFGSLKNEFTHFEKFESRDQAALELFSWIEVFYNRVRRHSTLNYLSPVDYEQKKC